MGPQGKGPRRGVGDGAVSPVIGMVLILAISVLGIVAVTNWGLPAITEMKANVALRASVGEFRDLDASLQRLISGTTGQTTLKWQPAISEGAIDVNPAGNRWLVAANVTNTQAPKADIRWAEVEDTNNRIALKLQGETIPFFRIRAWKWDGGASTELLVSENDVPDCTRAGAGNAAASWDVDTVKTLYLKTNQTVGCTAVNLNNVVLSFQVNRETLGGGVTPIHAAVLADVGHLHWASVTAARGPNHVYSSNGAIYGGTSDALVAQTSLPIAPPRSFTNATGVPSVSLFARLLKVNGTASFSATGEGGQERFSLYLNFVGTYTLANVENASAVYVYVFGNLREANYKALTNAVAGYTFVEESWVHGADTIKYLRQTEGMKPFRFSSVYSLVKVEG